MTLSASQCSPLSCILNSLTVKPALEKHLSEEAEGAEMQKLLQIRKLKILDHNFMYQFYSKRLKSLSFGEPRLGKLFSYLPTLKISCVQREWLKSLNFGGSVSGKPHCGTLNFGYR